MLVIVVAANVALLMFARAAGREREISVRYALGAGRRRIVAQLFAEGVALSSVSAILGLVAARYALRWLLHMREANAGGALPFWVNDSLTPSTVVYAAVLTILVAVIVGVVPALKITARGLDARLRSFSPGGGGYRFGGLWTGVIAAQVAVTVLFPAWAFFFHRWVVDGQNRDVGFAATQYLSARLAMDSEAAGRTAATIEELRRQLIAEPGVMAVTVADRLPGMRHSGGRFEIEGDETAPTSGYDVRVASVDADFFDALHAPVLAGRGFTPGDQASGRQLAIVNTSFVERVLRGRNPVGRRLRLIAREGERPAGPWVEIVGVVRDLGISGTDGVGLYRPLRSDFSSVHIALHIGEAPESFAARLRALAHRVEPEMRVYDLMALNKVGADQWLESQYMSRLLTVLSGMALLLSLVAIYAVMSFTVVQRTREIGTRVALGADPGQIVATIVRRPLVQIGVGIAAGGALVVLVYVGIMESTPTVFEASMIGAYAAAMLAVCFSACVVPILHTLRLEPSQVLRADA
jgi:putative ABC transport system permease protein